jgi:hypothetical protein
VDEHESTAAEIAGEGIDDGEGESHSDCSVDGIAAGFEDGDAGVGGEVVHGDDHGVRSARWLVVGKRECSLAGVVGSGVLRGRRLLRGEGQREGDSTSGERGKSAAAGFYGLGRHLDWEQLYGRERGEYTFCIAGATLNHEPDSGASQSHSAGSGYRPAHPEPPSIVAGRSVQWGIVPGPRWREGLPGV